MFWNKNISGVEYWFIGIFFTVYLLYFLKIVYISIKLKISARASFLKFLPRLFAFSLLIIALLEPSFGNYDNNARENASNKIIYFLVDVSKSMDAKDIAPTRLEKTKNELKKIVTYFPMDRFGIIAFASDAIVHTSLTTDTNILKELIGTLNTDYFATAGTNLEASFKLCLEKINETNFLNGTSAAIIAFTDGEDFSDVSESTINDIKRKRINLFLVGVGTKNGSYIYDKDGKILKNKNGSFVNTKLETEYLKSIGAQTNGRYLEYTNTNSPLNDIIEGIENLKGVKNLQSVNASKPGNKYHYPLIIAIFIICIDLLLPIQIFNLNNKSGN